MTNLTAAERDELHHAVLRDVLAAGETVPNVHATTETIVAAHVRTERDRLLARIEELAAASFDAYLSVAPMVRMRCVAEHPLRAFVAEERAR